MSKNGSKRSKMRLKAHLRFQTRVSPRLLWKFVFYSQEMINVKYPRIITKVGENGILPQRNKLGPKVKRGKGQSTLKIYIMRAKARSAGIRIFQTYRISASLEELRSQVARLVKLLRTFLRFCFCDSFCKQFSIHPFSVKFCIFFLINQ